MTDVITYPVSRVGFIGGGQLGRMMVIAAKQFGCECVVLDPVVGSPAGQVADQEIIGAYDDAARLSELASVTDVVTYDLENIGVDTLRDLRDQGACIYPSPDLLATLQDKLTQKQFLQQAGIPTSEFVGVENPNPDDFRQFGYPLAQKARRGGYDGRGVALMRSEADFADHLPVPSLIERFVEAEKEIGVLVARNVSGECRVYPVVEMCFRGGENILDRLLVPAQIPDDVAQTAQALAIRTAEAMDGVGVFGIEMFLTRDGELLVNEIAPRTHNSGHHTIEACVTDQFEQHLRAVLGLPLGSTELLSPAVMLNLLGEPGYHGRPRFEGLRDVLAIDGVCVHLYGKAVTSPYRKMGHVTVLGHSLDRALEKAVKVRDLLKITGEKST